MIRPKPFKLTCTKCKYSKKVAPLSDAISPMDSPRQNCPKCNAPMERSEIKESFFDKLFGK